MESNPALLLRTAAVVGERRHVLDGLDLEARRLEGADRALAARAGALDADLDLADPVLLRLVRDLFGGALRREGRRLARALVADRAGRGPADGRARLVGDADERVVERRLDVGDALGDDLLRLLLALELGVGSRVGAGGPRSPRASGRSHGCLILG